MANFGYSFLLVLAAFLWGSTFVAQIEGNDVGPFAFVCMRNFIATGILFGLANILDKLGKNPRCPQKQGRPPKALEGWRALRNCTFLCDELTADRAFPRLFRREGRFPHDLLYHFRPDSEHFFRQEDFPKNLALRYHHGHGTLLALHQGRFYRPAIGHYTCPLCACICGTHSRSRKIRSTLGQRKAFCDSVSRSCNTFHFPDVLCRFERVRRRIYDNRRSL